MSLPSRHRRWASFLAVLGLVVAASAPVFASLDCPVDPVPPGRFGTVCPWPGGGQGVNVVADPGFTVPFPITGMVANILHPYTVATLENGEAPDFYHEYLEGRYLHLGNYRGGCGFTSSQEPTAECEPSVQALLEGPPSCAYDHDDNVDGLRICSVTDVDGDGKKELQFRITYSALDGDDPLERSLESPTLTFELWKAPPGALTMGQIGPFNPPHGTNLTINTAPWELPNNSYQIMLRIDDSSCPGWNRLVGETENYVLTINGLGVSLKPLGSVKSIPIGCN